MMQWWKRQPQNTPEFFNHDPNIGHREAFHSIQLDSPGYRGISTPVTGHIVYLTSQNGTTWRRAQNGYSPGDGGGDLRAQSLRFDYASGYYYSSTVVLCRFYWNQWWVASPGDAEVHVTLNADMTGQSTAAATVLASDGTPTSDTLQVKPAFSLTSTVTSGTECVVMQRGNIWEAVLIPCTS